MRLPTVEECRALLETSADTQELPDGSTVWRISGHLYIPEQAEKIAEFCLITGQELTAIGTIAGMIDLARRIIRLEARDE